MTMANLHLKGLSQSGSSAQEDCKFNIKGQKYLFTNQDSVAKECWDCSRCPGKPWFRNAFFFFFFFKKSCDQLFVSWQEKRIRLDLLLFQQ